MANNLDFLRDIVNGTTPNDPDFNAIHDAIERHAITDEVLAIGAPQDHERINTCAAEIRMARFQSRLFQGVS